MKLTLAESVHLKSALVRMLEIFRRFHPANEDHVSGECFEEMARLVARQIDFINTATIEQEPHNPGTRLCDVCGGHGANPGSDNTNWLPCVDCHGTGKVP